jgi:hypothetical protein
MGATSGFSGSDALTGKPATDVLSPSERYHFTIIARGLTPGERAGALPVMLASGEKATLSMCYRNSNEKRRLSAAAPSRWMVISASYLPRGHSGPVLRPPI